MPGALYKPAARITRRILTPQSLRLRASALHWLAENPHKTRPKSDQFRKREFSTPVISTTCNVNALKCTDFPVKHCRPLELGVSLVIGVWGFHFPSPLTKRDKTGRFPNLKKLPRCARGTYADAPTVRLILDSRVSLRSLRLFRSPPTRIKPEFCGHPKLRLSTLDPRRSTPPQTTLPAPPRAPYSLRSSALETSAQ